MATERNLPNRERWELCPAAAELFRPLVRYFDGKAKGELAQRKLRLFICAAVKLLPEELMTSQGVASISFGERAAAGEASVEELNQAERTANREMIAASLAMCALPEVESDQATRKWKVAVAVWRTVLPSLSFKDAVNVSEIVRDLTLPNRPATDPLPPLVRDVFGYPFAPVRFEKQWKTEAVKLLAGGIHAEGKFDRLPILADALEEAGCDDADALGHCRGPGPHVRGCWVVDLVRGVHWQPKL